MHYNLSQPLFLLSPSWGEKKDNGGIREVSTESQPQQPADIPAQDQFLLVGRQGGEKDTPQAVAQINERDVGTEDHSFRADLASAVATAQRYGIHLQALVFPRNQFNPAYAQDIVDAGFRVCRINAAGWLYREGAGDRYFRPDVRAARLLDAYLGLAGSQVIAWDAIPFVNGLCCLPESRFLRPFAPRLRAIEPLRLERITGEIQKAARDRGVFHLWWHPHNFGRYTEENLALLRRILQAFQRCRETWGMRSLTMSDAAAVAASIQAGLQGGAARCA